MAGSSMAFSAMDAQRERRIALLTGRLPPMLARRIDRLRQPEARRLRTTAGILLILGGLLSILPLLGLWMLPLGILLLAEDVPPLRRLTDRALGWIEQRRPHWLGLPR